MDLPYVMEQIYSLYEICSLEFSTIKWNLNGNHWYSNYFWIFKTKVFEGFFWLSYLKRQEMVDILKTFGLRVCWRLTVGEGVLRLLRRRWSDIPGDWTSELYMLHNSADSCHIWEYWVNNSNENDISYW